MPCGVVYWTHTLFAVLNSAFVPSVSVPAPPSQPMRQAPPPWGIESVAPFWSVTETFSTTPEAMQNEVQEISASSVIVSLPLQNIRSNACVPESVLDSPTPIVRSTAIADAAIAKAKHAITRFILKFLFFL